MSYDTEHVRNVDTDLGAVAGIPTFTELLENTNLASLYTSIRQSSAVTGPELVETTNVSKKTVYEYLHKLERAGLVTKTGEAGGTSMYRAEDFEMRLTVRDVEVSITPALITVVAHGDKYPVIGRVLEDHGLVSFALTHDLVKAHSDGDVTIRQIADLADLSPGTAYDIVEAIYTIHDLANDDSSPKTYTPDDFEDAEGDVRDEFVDS